MWQCLPKPSFTNNHNCVAWWVEQVATPLWWPELASVLGQRDIYHLAWLVWASFQMPQYCYATTKGFNNYTVPPTPHCLDLDAYLLMGGSEIWLTGLSPEATTKDLAYAKALQHWADLAKPTLPGKSCQLSECVRVEGGDGALYYFYGCWGVWPSRALALVMNHPL